MFSKNQKLLRSLISRNNSHDTLPQIIGREKIETFYRELCMEKVCPDFISLVDMAQGNAEPSDQQISSWSEACNWYNGTWYTD